MVYEVGNHRGKVKFECYECALRFYNEAHLKDEKKYLKDISSNKILKNTYGWF